MSYVKYNEDNIKINDDRIYMSKKIEIIHVPSPIFFICPYCNRVFETKIKLFSHIKNEHNLYNQIILINGIIPKNDNEIYVSEVNSVIVKSYEIGLKVMIDDKVIISDENGIFELTSYVKESMKKGFCFLKIGNKSISLKLLSVDAVTNPVVFETIDKWQKMILEDRIIEKNYPSSINEAEKQYLDAFFNYYVACKSKGDSKCNRYFDAYSVLSKFTNLNSMALCVLKVISFKLNWYRTLDILSVENDDFRIISNFINCSNIHIVINENMSGQLYIEDELQEMIECFVKYYNQDYKYVDKFLSKFSNIYDIDDINFKDKVLLLKARRAKDLNNIREMDYYYHEIVNESLKEDKLKYKRLNENE